MADTNIDKTIGEDEDNSLSEVNEDADPQREDETEQNDENVGTDAKSHPKRVLVESIERFIN